MTTMTAAAAAVTVAHAIEDIATDVAGAAMSMEEDGEEEDGIGDNFKSEQHFNKERQ